MKQSHRHTKAEQNQLQPDDRAVHDWYRFILSFPAHLVRNYLQQFEINSNHWVLDPFCGTGTTLVECKKLGTPSVGIEANLIAHFASQIKVDWDPDPDGLIQHTLQVAEAARSELESAGLTDVPTFTSEDWPIHHSLRSLPDESHKLLLENSISPLPLHKTLVLLDCLRQYADERYYGHQRLALAKALVNSISNLHFGPEVGVGRAKPDTPVIASWLSEVCLMAEDLREFAVKGETPATVHAADSRQIHQVLVPCSIDAVITSPPYPNEKDYTRTTRLESVLLGFIHNKAELQALKQNLVRSNTRGVYKVDDDDQWISEHPEIQQIAATIETQRIKLGKTSGFERLYARATKLYFGGMARHLANLRPVLRPGARLAYVVGDQASYFRTLIPTGQLLAKIAQSLGYELVSIDLFRTRLSTITKELLREEVVVLRWLDGG